MSRIPSFSASDIHEKTVDEVFSSIQQLGQKYDQGFLENLMLYIKRDETLKNFYIRYIYECEIVKTIITMDENTNNSHLFDMLSMIVGDMKNAKTVDSISVLDSQFHRLLFCVAGQQEFFEWYQLNSESLQVFLGNFWNVVGIGTDEHKELLDIHENIYKYIKAKDEKNALDSVQKHFSVLLLNLLFMMFSSVEK
jgi:DNA-binding GntR family transcriptional regulator